VYFKQESIKCNKKNCSKCSGNGRHKGYYYARLWIPELKKLKRFYVGRVLNIETKAKVSKKIVDFINETFAGNSRKRDHYINNLELF